MFIYSFNRKNLTQYQLTLCGGLGFMTSREYSMNHTVSKLNYMRFVERYNQTDPTDLDERMIPILERFNKIPGVVSIFCCSGHLVTEPDFDERNHRQSHIIFAVEEGQVGIQERFSQWLSNLTWNDWKISKPQLMMINLMLPFRSIYPSGYIDSARYNAWELAMDFHSDAGDIAIKESVRLWDSLLSYLTIGVAETENVN